MMLYPNPVVKGIDHPFGFSFPGDYYTLYNVNGKKLKSDQILSEITTLIFRNMHPEYMLWSLKTTDRFSGKR
jgi:hypothetical protein